MRMKWLGREKQGWQPLRRAWDYLCNPADFPDPSSRPRRPAGDATPVSFLQTPLTWASLSEFLSPVDMAFSLFHVSSQPFHHFHASVCTNLPRRLLRTRARKKQVGRGIKIYWVLTMRNEIKNITILSRQFTYMNIFNPHCYFETWVLLYFLNNPRTRTRRGQVTYLRPTARKEWKIRNDRR